jgi:glyoxylase-like metal-dependent hydrolase (beta-lactamase superfamily II)
VDQVQAPAQLADQIDLIATPGHSPGHMSVRIRSRGEEAVIAGDALHTAAQCSHPEWHFRFDADPVQAEASRRALLALLVESGARVIVPHVALPSIGRVTRRADGAVWLPDGAGPAGG